MAIPRLKRTFRWAILCGLMLALFAGQVLALGLGRIEVKSRAGQPLLAEIQVVSGDPAELDALRARLASPDTFRRIGLPAPDAVVSGLEFTVALDARGNPVIRVTTREPVTQPVLTFLVEVDWGQGRLVREYSALVDTPQTMAAAVQPAIEAPVAAPSNTIVRPDAPLVADDGTGEETGSSSASAQDGAVDGGMATATEDEPAPEAAPASPAPVIPAAPAAPAAPVAEAPVAARDEHTVRAGETLGAIAQQLVGEGVTREQAIVALFRANPRAFIANNLNLVREGAVLRIPDRDEMAGLDLRESRALMREQIAAWRDMSRPAPQPMATTEGEGAAATATAATGDEGAAKGGGATSRADARLEIVPSSAAAGQQAGTRSGIEAGGEGEMLRQELQQELLQNRETLAARDAEVEELKARVADLERLQAQQAQLLQLKDSELASAQERLATTGAEPPAAEAAAQEGSGLPWLWIGAGLLLVAVVAWLLAKRKSKAAPRPRFGSSRELPPVAGRSGDARGVSVSAAMARDEAGGRRADAPPPSTPAWHAGPSPAAPDAVAEVEPPAQPVQAPEPAQGAMPAEPAHDRAGAPAAPAAAALDPAQGVERIELARAYLDLGDIDTARDLLREVAEAGEPSARAEASRLLEGIA